MEVITPGPGNLVEVEAQYSEPRMKLEELRTRLQADPEVFYAGDVCTKPLSRRQDLFDLRREQMIEEVRVTLAPSRPIFKESKYNAFLVSLRDKNPDLLHVWGMGGRFMDPEDNTVDALAIGELRFNEVIGTREEMIQISPVDTEAFIRAGISTDAPFTTVTEYLRSGLVRVYPDPLTAAAVHQYMLARGNERVVSSGPFAALTDELRPVMSGRLIKEIKDAYKTNLMPTSLQLP